MNHMRNCGQLALSLTPFDARLFINGAFNRHENLQGQAFYRERIALPPGLNSV